MKSRENTPVSALLLAFLPLFAAGCTSLQRPTRYVQLPEYGVLPAVEHRGGTTEILARYVAYDFFVDPKGEIGGHLRASLPQTESEARRIFEANLAVRRRVQRKAELEELPWAPVYLVEWAPGIAILTERLAHRADAPPTAGPAPGIPEQREGPPPEDWSFRLRVVDAGDRPLPGVAVLPLAATVDFTVWADETGRRTFPQARRVPFEVSPELAFRLARYLRDRPATAHGVIVAPPAVTDAQGEWSRELYRAKTGVYLLLHRDGYEPVAALVAPGNETAELTVRLSPAGPYARPPEDNPWLAAGRLDDQLGYWHTVYGLSFNIPKHLPPPPPPLTTEATRALIERIEAVAPDYPPLESARFFLAVERGDHEEARRHGRFVDDTAYVRALYGFTWEFGSPL